MVKKKRSIFRELMSGVADMKAERQGKLTLRSHHVQVADGPNVGPEMIRDTRERLRMSQGVFAERLHVNRRTLERWEQGRSRPNDQAAALILLVRAFPDTLARLATAFAAGA